MNCEILTIGSELLLGDIVDTNSSYLARELNLIGFDVVFHTTVGDNYSRIKDVLSLAVKRADLVITTGGLGPTEDDLTREVIADLVGVPLRFKQHLMDQIESFFRQFGYRMPENNRKQAFIPDGAIPVPNEVGTAPGFSVNKGASLIVALPGVPKELRYIFKNKVVPCLKKHFRLDRELITSRILKVTGMGESKVDTQIKDLVDPTANPRVGILAAPGDISIRITVHAKSAMEADNLISPLEQEIRARLGTHLYGVNDDTLELVVINLLNKRGETLSVVETFSGGTLAARLQSSPSSPLHEAIVLAKREQISSFLGKQCLRNSRRTAEALARKIRDVGNSSVGLALLGTLNKAEKGYKVYAHAVVSGKHINGVYNCKMGGDIPTLQSRGATIALNTLRLPLIS